MPHLTYHNFLLGFIAIIAFTRLHVTCQGVTVLPMHHRYTITTAPTTTFTPPSSCSSSKYWFGTFTDVDPVPKGEDGFANVVMYKAGCLADVNCCPEGYGGVDRDLKAPEPIFDPGVCPVGYLGRAVWLDGKYGEAGGVVYCCPSSLTTTLSHESARNILCVSTSIEYSTTIKEGVRWTHPTYHIVAATPIYVIPPLPLSPPWVILRARETAEPTASANSTNAAPPPKNSPTTGMKIAASFAAVIISILLVSIVISCLKRTKWWKNRFRRPRRDTESGGGGGGGGGGAAPQNEEEVIKLVEQSLRRERTGETPPPPDYSNKLGPEDVRNKAVEAYNETSRRERLRTEFGEDLPLPYESSGRVRLSRPRPSDSVPMGLPAVF